MESDTLTSTKDFWTGALGLGPVLVPTARVTGSLLFYSAVRFDCATQWLLGALIEEARAESEEGLFRRSAVRSVPRSWRDL